VVRKPLHWLADDLTVPRLSSEAAQEIGALLEIICLGEMPPMPHSRPMPSVGTRCHELRVNDRDQTWRIVYHIARDAVVVLDVFSKKTRRTPKAVIERCKQRLRCYEREC
jgi:phage-related protein